MSPRGYRLAATVSAAVLVACGGGGGDATASNDNWVVLGSSTAAGTGASSGHGWVTLLASAEVPRGVAVQNLARSGAVTYQALPSATSTVQGRPAPDPSMNTDRAATYAPRRVLLAFPTNDTAAGYSSSETLINVQAMRIALHSLGSVVMVLSTQPRDAFDANQNATLADIDRQLATTWGPCYVDVRTGLDDGTGKIVPAYAAGDGVHLNDAGHAVVFQRVQAAIDAGGCR